jgi:CRISPR-associated protein Cas1
VDKQIVEISKDDFSLSLDRGFLVLKNLNATHKIPLENILSVIISANRAMLSKNIINAICDNGGSIICCNDKYAPNTIILPYIGHYLSAPRIKSQIAASAPLNKNLWKEIVIAKISNQARILEYCGGDVKHVSALKILAKNVKSDDSGNCEGVAAKIYFKALFGHDFIRDRNAGDINLLLNYAYTVIRTAIARAIAGNGLLPQIGIKHCSQMNAMPLADDLIEPFRPVADMIVYDLVKDTDSVIELNSEMKRTLVSVLQKPVTIKKCIVSLSDGIYYFVGTLMNSYKDKKIKLEFPQIV